MQTNDSAEEIFQLASQILQALNERDLETACSFGDRILFSFEVEDWMHADKAKVSAILYALAQILSRHCLYRIETVDTPARACQLDRIDRALGIVYSSEGQTRPVLVDSTLETSARWTFYYAVSALHRRRYQVAAQYFADVLRDGERLDDYDIQANAHFFLSTCNRKLNGQAGAIQHLVMAKEALKQLPNMAKRMAVVDVRSAWEEFSSGKFDELTERANFAIENFGTDYATLGHALSLKARIERRRGHYASARSLTEEAIENYKRRDPHHRALARAYSNLAHTYLLLVAKEPNPAVRTDLITKAAASLDSAERIYEARHYDRNTRPEVGQLRSLVEFQQGQLTTAFQSADAVYEEARSRNDFVEMSSARVIQCMCLLNSLSLGPSGPVKVAASLENTRKAHKLALGAIDDAAKIQRGVHDRRKARPYIWLGLIVLRKPFLDLEQARSCRAKAFDLLPIPKDQTGYIGEELALLDEKIKLRERDLSLKSKNGAVVCTVRTEDLPDRSWKQTMEWIEESIISALVHDANMTDNEIIDWANINQNALTKIKKRSMEDKLIDKDHIDRRRGRHMKALGKANAP